MRHATQQATIMMRRIPSASIQLRSVLPRRPERSSGSLKDAAGRMNLKPEHINTIKETLSRFLPNVRVYLFGSRLNGSPRSDSDCDLALDAGRPLSLNEINEIRDALERSTLPYLFDLTDVQTAAPEFIHRISSEWLEI